MKKISTAVNEVMGEVMEEAKETDCVGVEKIPVS